MFDYFNLEKKNNICTICDIIKLYLKEDGRESIKEYLQNIFGGFILSSCTDETDELYLLNTKILLENLDYQNKFYSIIQNSPSIIIDKKNNNFIIQHFNNINGINQINNYDWKEIKVSYIYPGLNIILFFHNKNWVICSENTFDIEIDIYGYGTLKLILEKLKNKVDFDTLNKDYYYQMIYQNNKSRNYVDNILLNNSFEEFLLVNSYKLNTFEIVECQVSNINKIQDLYFSCLDELLMKLDYISYDNKINKKLTYAGFNLKIIKDNRNINNIYTYNDIYNFVKKNISENDNIYKIYLELYQKNNLSEILPYISKYSSEIIHRLNMSMKTLSREILNIYHTTRKKKHQELYKLLPELYKKILYGLHGVYINSRKKDIINRKPIEYDETKSITVHDVYYYIKELTCYQLIELFKERGELLKNSNFNNIMNHDCIYTLTQSKLMSND